MKACLKMMITPPAIHQVTIHTFGRAGHGSAIQAGIMAGTPAPIGANTQAGALAAIRAGIADEKRALLRRLERKVNNVRYSAIIHLFLNCAGRAVD